LSDRTFASLIAMSKKVANLAKALPTMGRLSLVEEEAVKIFGLGAGFHKAARTRSQLSFDHPRSFIS